MQLGRGLRAWWRLTRSGRHSDRQRSGAARCNSRPSSHRSGGGREQTKRCFLDGLNVGDEARSGRLGCKRRLPFRLGGACDLPGQHGRNHGGSVPALLGRAVKRAVFESADPMVREPLTPGYALIEVSPLGQWGLQLSVASAAALGMEPIKCCRPDAGFASCTFRKDVGVSLYLVASG